MRLRGKVALITGGGRGIGRASAIAMAREGARVAIGDIDSALLESTLSAIQAFGGEAAAYEMDVSDRHQVRQVVDAVYDRFGRIDVLLNNAGIYEILAFEEITEEQWDRLLDINLKGVFLCSQAVVGGMKRQRSGRIINMSSSAGKTGGVLCGVHYSVSKAGIICLTKSLARELGPYGITVNAIAPGRIDTPMIQSASEEENEALCQQTPLRRLGTPEDVAHAVLFLASDDAAFITGEVLDVNGGLLMD
jgi:3-oxoacyl-[acyl-carrier protein] reductase